MVIAETQSTPAARRQTRQGLAEGLRIAQPAECSGPLEMAAASGGNCCPVRCSTQPSRLHTAREIRAPADSSAQRGCSMAGARSEKRLRVIRMMSARARAATARAAVPAGIPRRRQGIEGVDQHHVDIARQLQVLEAVVEQQHVHAETCRSSSVPLAITVGPDPTGATPERMKICGSSPEYSGRTAAPGASTRCLFERCRGRSRGSGCRAAAALPPASPPGAARRASCPCRPW